MLSKHRTGAKSFRASPLSSTVNGAFIGAQHRRRPGWRTLAGELHTCFHDPLQNICGLKGTAAP